jgi:hypothetical protein
LTEDDETAESIARDIRLSMEIMNIHLHNRAWINDRVAALVKIAGGRKMEWEVTFVEWTSKQLPALLKDGWEPFTVTDDEDTPPTIWLRRRVPG